MGSQILIQMIILANTRQIDSVMVVVVMMIIQYTMVTSAANKCIPCISFIRATANITHLVNVMIVVRLSIC